MYIYIHGHPRKRQPICVCTHSRAHARWWCSCGAYLAQRDNRRGVPRADVRVERGRRGERLRAEPHAVHADRKGSHVSAQIRECPKTHAHALTRMDAHVGASVVQAHIGDTFIYVAMRIDMYTCIYHLYQSILFATTMAKKRERRTHAHAVQSRIVNHIRIC